MDKGISHVLSMSILLYGLQRPIFNSQDKEPYSFVGLKAQEKTGLLLMPTAKVTKNVSAAEGGGNVLCSILISIKTKAWLYSFEKEYMFYQADYFRNHPQFAFLDVADNVTYPYNELLHIAVETGMCGLVLFLLVVSPFVFSDERTLKAALAAWLIFAMFSYPVNVVPLMMDFALFIELRRGKTVSVLDINRIFCGIAVVPLMGLLAVCGHVMLFLM